MTLAMLNFWANMKDFCPFWMAQLYGSAIFLNEEKKKQRVINLNFSRERHQFHVFMFCVQYASRDFPHEKLGKI